MGPFCCLFHLLGRWSFIVKGVVHHNRSCHQQHTFLIGGLLRKAHSKGIFMGRASSCRIRDLLNDATLSTLDRVANRHITSAATASTGVTTAAGTASDIFGDGVHVVSGLVGHGEFREAGAAEATVVLHFANLFLVGDAHHGHAVTTARQTVTPGATHAVVIKAIQRFVGRILHSQIKVTATDASQTAATTAQLLDGLEQRRAVLCDNRVLFIADATSAASGAVEGLFQHKNTRLIQETRHC